MKTKTPHIYKPFILPALLLLFVAGIGEMHAQRFSATANINTFTRNNLSNDARADFNGTTNLSLNLRYYTRSKIGFRVGAGVENLNYEVNNGLSTDLGVRRQDITGILGIEWHPTLGDWMDIYPGIYIPVTVVGEDLVSRNIDDFRNGTVKAGLGTVLGANIRFLRILRLGVEFDARYQSFKSATLDAISDVSLRPYGRLNYTANLTIGVLL
ncbi:MAG: hypothetical protein AAGI38_11780 [Bacteroidota bacterium]